jgi:hypothetical protein
MRREDAIIIRTQNGRRELARSWREETAYDLSEPRRGTHMIVMRNEDGMKGFRANEAKPRFTSLYCQIRNRL